MGCALVILLPLRGHFWEFLVFRLHLKLARSILALKLSVTTTQCMYMYQLANHKPACLTIGQLILSLIGQLILSLIGQLILSLIGQLILSLIGQLIL